jgi:transposase
MDGFDPGERHPEGVVRRDVAGVPVRPGPDPAQERALRSHAGAARAAFNWGLARVKANLGQRDAEKSYGLEGDGLTPPLSWSLYSLRKEWNIAKDEVAPWWGECSKEAFSTGLDQLARALKNWGDSRTGRRKGKPAGFPRFRSRRRARPSVRFTTGALRCEARHAVLPRIGRVKLHEDGARLAALVAAGTARVLSVTVRYERGRWHASFTVDTEITRPAPARPDAVVGVDLGIKTLAVLSTGEQIPNPRMPGRRYKASPPSTGRSRPRISALRCASVSVAGPSCSIPTVWAASDSRPPPWSRTGPATAMSWSRSTTSTTPTSSCSRAGA